MALEHLSDSEYEALKKSGLAILNDDAYSRLKLPEGYGMPSREEQEAQKYAEQHPVETSIQKAGEAVEGVIKAPIEKAVQAGQKVDELSGGAVSQVLNESEQMKILGYIAKVGEFSRGGWEQIEDQFRKLQTTEEDKVSRIKNFIAASAANIANITGEAIPADKFSIVAASLPIDRIGITRRGWGRSIAKQANKLAGGESGPLGLKKAEIAQRRNILTVKKAADIEEQALEGIKETIKPASKELGLMEHGELIKKSLLGGTETIPKFEGAKFIGFQEGAGMRFPLYNYVPPGEKLPFTYSADTLKEMGFKQIGTEDVKVAGKKLQEKIRLGLAQPGEVPAGVSAVPNKYQVLQEELSKEAPSPMFRTMKRVEDMQEELSSILGPDAKKLDKTAQFFLDLKGPVSPNVLWENSKELSKLIDRVGKDTPVGAQLIELRNSVKADFVDSLSMKPELLNKVLSVDETYKTWKNKYRVSKLIESKDPSDVPEVLMKKPETVLAAREALSPEVFQTIKDRETRQFLREIYDAKPEKKASVAEKFFTGQAGEARKLLYTEEEISNFTQLANTSVKAELIFKEEADLFEEMSKLKRSGDVPFSGRRTTDKPKFYETWAKKLAAPVAGGSAFTLLWVIHHPNWAIAAATAGIAPSAIAKIWVKTPGLRWKINSALKSGSSKELRKIVTYATTQSLFRNKEQSDEAPTK